MLIGNEYLPPERQREWLSAAILRPLIGQLETNSGPEAPLTAPQLVQQALEALTRASKGFSLRLCENRPELVRKYCCMQRKRSLSYSAARYNNLGLKFMWEWNLRSHQFHAHTHAAHRQRRAAQRLQGLQRRGLQRRVLQRRVLRCTYVAPC